MKKGKLAKPQPENIKIQDLTPDFAGFRISF